VKILRFADRRSSTQIGPKFHCGDLQTRCIGWQSKPTSSIAVLRQKPKHLRTSTGYWVSNDFLVAMALQSGNPGAHTNAEIQKDRLPAWERLVIDKEKIAEIYYWLVSKRNDATLEDVKQALLSLLEALGERR
jgi:hypothetical protein